VPTSIKDELPEKNGFHLCKNNLSEGWAGYVWFSDGHFYDNQNIEVTHWLKKTTIAEYIKELQRKGAATSSPNCKI